GRAQAWRTEHLRRFRGRASRKRRPAPDGRVHWLCPGAPFCDAPRTLPPGSPDNRGFVTGDRRFYESQTADVRRSAPAVSRNRDPIVDVLKEWLPERGLVLELASGTGEHAVYFAERFPNLDWQPSDIHPDALTSIAAWREAAGLKNVREPIVVDASSGHWPIDHADAVLSINMVHISPWASALGLLDGAARLLRAGSPLILYGPWLKDEFPTAPSNLA